MDSSVWVLLLLVVMVLELGAVTFTLYGLLHDVGHAGDYCCNQINASTVHDALDEIKTTLNSIERNSEGVRETE